MKKRKPRVPDFQKIDRQIKSIYKAVAVETVEGFAKSERKKFIRAIEQQRFRSFQLYPLSKNYLKLKKKYRRDLRTMISTRQYIDHIQVHKETTEEGKTQFRIGFKPSDMAKNVKGQLTSTPLNLVAAVNERGSATANIPARPHWAPFKKDIARRAKKLRVTIREKFLKALFKNLGGVKRKKR